ncbi:LysM peptidoglycan-binding domain-containing protein [Intrasporangium sp.]|uniref:LysM peptidoglycan-binding domain-containing protein n=1 Tax=Intrasporangium sp. TaxID=1925024 RepID=UPI003365A1E9
MLPVDVAQLSPPAQVLFTEQAARTWRTVVVRPGDTLWDLALANRTTPAAIVAKNRLPAGGAMIHPGQRLLVPGAKTPPRGKTSSPPAGSANRPASRPASHPANRPVSGRVHVVRAGDTMTGIAARYGVALTTLLAANRQANPGMIHPGQRLLVPAATTPAGAKTSSRRAAAANRPASHPANRPAGGRVHVVRAGDTMTGIAARYGVALTTLLAANRQANPGMIHPGQRIVVPGAPAPRVPTSTRPRPTSENTFAGYTYSDETVRAARKNREALATAQVPSRTELAAMIRRTAVRHGVDPTLALAIGWQESGWNQRAVSVANAIGAMQVIPSSGEWASELAGRRLDLLDAQDNVTAGVVILRALRSSADSVEEAVAGYYQGLRSVRTKGMFADTKTYVAAVQAHMKWL